MTKRPLQIGLALLLTLAIAVAVYYRESFDIERIEQWLMQAEGWAPLVFILIYSVAAVLFLPGSVFTLAGGVIFGPFYGVIYNLIGATTGAALSFLVARYLASDFVMAKAGGKLKQLINGVEAEGWRFVAFTRLVPLFPFNLLNYAFGLTRIRFTEYVIATFIFIIPGAIAYTYLGHAGREALSGGDDLIKTILIALALLAAAMFLPRFVKTLRRGPGIDIAELKRRIEQQQTMLLDVRSKKEFAADGHIETALNIPVGQLEAELIKLEDYIEQPISIVCRTDKRSAAAADILLKHGFKDVQVVRGGMMAWLKQG